MNYLKLQYINFRERVRELLCKKFHKKHYITRFGNVRFCRKCDSFRKIYR